MLKGSGIPVPAEDQESWANLAYVAQVNQPPRTALQAVNFPGRA